MARKFVSKNGEEEEIEKYKIITKKGGAAKCFARLWRSKFVTGRVTEMAKPCQSARRNAWRARKGGRWGWKGGRGTQTPPPGGGETVQSN